MHEYMPERSAGAIRRVRFALIPGGARRQVKLCRGVEVLFGLATCLPPKAGGQVPGFHGGAFAFPAPASKLIRGPLLALASHPTFNGK